ncbi:hypothetical protein TREMEDRAFT_60309 [Tremella mesenterica DSM 1558]|uniref:uncharacterized protein n=1 Tax=Tremella mesenterica (strain ATCC 24925 / CBS 8224 / DSM 1558 / NBRC 9311 / NRRL Y-6157 / RJB 2259-6 / UBC 559-6) TaxID=578456 RepID=UPI0003F49128|nr:uncharacterized protein TREMEDRAFT_60309 [Tremella mesenterica DSM 1558]EIW71379.1 hypothetical protein TREMEDRAFT_60309 [Tremella mesenterica DSM 1558]
MADVLPQVFNNSSILPSSSTQLPDGGTIETVVYTSTVTVGDGIGGFELSKELVSSTILVPASSSSVSAGGTSKPATSVVGGANPKPAPSSSISSLTPSSMSSLTSSSSQLAQPSVINASAFSSSPSSIVSSVPLSRTFHNDLIVSSSTQSTHTTQSFTTQAALLRSSSSSGSSSSRPTSSSHTSSSMSKVPNAITSTSTVTVPPVTNVDVSASSIKTYVSGSVTYSGSAAVAAIAAADAINTGGTSTEKTGGSKLSSIAIVGIVLGVLGFLVICYLSWYNWKKKRDRDALGEELNDDHFDADGQPIQFTEKMSHERRGSSESRSGKRRRQKRNDRPSRSGRRRSNGNPFDDGDWYADPYDDQHEIGPPTTTGFDPVYDYQQHQHLDEGMINPYEEEYHHEDQTHYSGFGGERTTYPSLSEYYDSTQNDPSRSLVTSQSYLESSPFEDPRPAPQPQSFPRQPERAHSFVSTEPRRTSLAYAGTRPTSDTFSELAQPTPATAALLPWLGKSEPVPPPVPAIPIASSSNYAGGGGVPPPQPSFKGPMGVRPVVGVRENQRQGPAPVMAQTPMGEYGYPDIIPNFR